MTKAQKNKVKLNSIVSVKDYGAKGDNTTDDTAAIQAALDAIYAKSGGTLFFPAGIYKVSSIVKNWTDPLTVNIRGEGKRATIIKKIDSSTTPVFNFSSNVGVLETYSSISDLRIQGNSKLSPGIQLTRWARFDIERIQIDSGDVALENIGSLVFSVYDPTIQDNNIGYRSRKSVSGPIYCNLIQFFGGVISNNTTFAMDIGDAAGVHLLGVDLSFNGTAANTSTGAILLRSTMDDETGYSIFSMRGGWLESNFGWAFRTEACAGLITEFHDVVCSANEAGRVAQIGAVYSSTINGMVAGGPSDTVTVAAARSMITNSLIANLTDTSTSYRHLNVGTSAAQISDTHAGIFKRMKLASQDFLYGRSDQISGGGTNDVDLFLGGTGNIRLMVNSTRPLTIGNNAVGFYGTTPVAKPTVTGAKGGNAALTSLMTQLAALGLVTDSTT